jgi:hypothetical protein
MASSAEAGDEPTSVVQQHVKTQSWRVLDLSNAGLRRGYLARSGQKNGV